MHRYALKSPNHTRRHIFMVYPIKMNITASLIANHINGTTNFRRIFMRSLSNGKNCFLLKQSSVFN
ncbi:hypothetical protein EMIT0162MI3_10549 [Pseudomonas chlororaphis]